MTFVYIELADTAPSPSAPLAHAWVYWREGNNRSLLRTDATGMLFELRPAGEPHDPFDYDKPFLAEIGSTVELCYSRFARSTPDVILDDHPDAFITRVLELDDADGDAHDAHPVAELPARPAEVTDRLVAHVEAALAQAGGGAIDADPRHLFAVDDPDGQSIAAPFLGAVAQRRPMTRKRRRRAPVAPHTPAAPPTTTNTLVPAPYVRVVLPDIRIEVATPEELGFWVMLTELPTDAYLTDGLPQGAAAWEGAHLSVRGNTPAQGAPNSRPKERGVVIKGSLDARASSLVIEVTDFAGTALSLLPDPAQAATATSIAATLDAPAGQLRPFSASVFFAEPSNAFGLVRIVFHATGTPVALVETLMCQLACAQIALVNDRDSNTNGTIAGPVPSESDDVVIADFRHSPRPNRAAITDELRLRRMVRYPIQVRDRAVSATNATLMQKPEMPMWMAEFHLVGVSLANLEWLLVFRHLFKWQNTGRGRRLRFGLTWKLRIQWEGPDWGTRDREVSSRAHRTLFDVPNVTLEVALGLARDAANSKLLADPPRIVSSVTPAPARIPFPVAGRRLAAVVAADRAWGRAAGAATKAALVLEWQPRVVDSEQNEAMRGGEGDLVAVAPTLNGADVPAGIHRADRQPAASNEIRIPKFRIPGTNPQVDQAHMDALVDTLVAAYHAEHRAEEAIGVLHVRTWQATLRLILRFESKGMHFRVHPAPIVADATARIHYVSDYFGHAHDMPLFGPPHGYGIAQLDMPKPTDQQVWSFLANLERAVELTMHNKARDAYEHLHEHLANDHRSRAVFQREVVRRYNGGAEFRWNGHQFEMHPTRQWADRDHTKPNSQLPYPNNVLGTRIVYVVGTGAGATFPAVPFHPADFGPLTDLAP